MDQTIKVLLVEDLEDDALLLVRELESNNIKVEWACVDKPESFSKILHEQYWDIVISDFIIPGFGGLEALKLLKESKKEIPFILVSGKIGEEQAVELLKLGADDCIMKNNLSKIYPAVMREIKEYEDRRKRITAENALKESEEKYRTLTDNVDIGIYRSTPGDKGKFIEVNKAAVRIFGCVSKEELLSKTPDSFYKKSSERAVFNEKMLKYGHITNEECTILRPDGAEFIALETTIAVKDQNGLPLYYDGIIEDITERKQMENMLVQSEKMASIGTLAAGIAHEINNPMGYIYSNLKVLQKYNNRLTDFLSGLKRSFNSPSTPDLKEEIRQTVSKYDVDFVIEDMSAAIQESIDGAEKVTKIVADLKDISRQEKFEIKSEDINKIIEKSLNIVQNELKYKTEIKKDYSNIDPVECDAQRISQVIINLLVNAGQAIEKHGEITIKTLQVNDTVSIEIADTGSGIPEEIIDKIFDAFFTTKDPGKGTGLGLSISYRIINEHNGTIDVLSKKNEGTRFIIKLPLKYQSRLKEKKVLIVDDEQSVVQTLKKMIYDYCPYLSVRGALDGFSAGEIINEFEPQLVFLDISMPNLNGFEVCRKISSSGRYNDTKIVVFSGLEEEDLETQAFEAGAYEFLRKPMTREKVFNTLEKCI